MGVKIAVLVMISVSVVVCKLSYDPSNYLEVYPDPTDPGVLNNRTPLHFALIQSLGGPLSQLDGSGAVAGVKVALDRINADSTLLPGYSLHYTFTDSKCNRTESLNALYSQLFHEPRKLGIIGGGCSVATEPTAEISHYYNLTQISCVATSFVLRDRVKFPGYFQILSTADRLAFGYFGVIRAFGWRRVGLLIQDENRFTVTMDILKDLLTKAGIAYIENTFSSSDGPAGLRPDPFEENTRIYVMSMFSRHIRHLLCEAYHGNKKFPQYMFLTLARNRPYWWTIQTPGLSCTPQDRESVLLSMLGVTESPFFNELSANLDFPTDTNITAREFLDEELDFLGEPPLNLSYFQYSQYCHDATWTLAYALNATLNDISDSAVNAKIARSINSSLPFALEDFDYNNHKLMEIMFRHIENTDFIGITGQVGFGDQGIRTFDTAYVVQFRANLTDEGGLELAEIGTVDLRNYSFNYVPEESEASVWQGPITYDGVADVRIVTPHPAMAVLFISLGVIGILFALACIIFNFKFRNKKLIRLASSKLNYMIGIGAIILYVNNIFYFFGNNPDVANAFCNVTPWLISTGYSLCYGTILVKMGRLYYIFNKPSPNKKVLKDWMLALGVAALLVVDLTILLTYTIVEGIRGNLVVQQIVNKENPMDVQGELGFRTNNYIYLCDSTAARKIFLGVLYGYKMVLQVIALIFTFSVRKVKITGLDDSKYMGISVYVTSVIMAVIIVATYTVQDLIHVFATLYCAGFLFGTTLILILVFVPLMVNLYRDPKGENIVLTTRSSASKVNMKNLSTVDLTERQNNNMIEETRQLGNNAQAAVRNQK